MRRRTGQKWLVIGLYLNAAMLGAILLVLLGRDGPPRLLSGAWGQNQLPIGGGAGVFIVPAQFAEKVYGCYIMDIDAQTLCAYQYRPHDGQLRLVAARYFRWDRLLREFNTEKPTPAEVQDLVEQQQAAQRVLEPARQRPAVEPPQQP
jgi:hypothetical protein